MRSGRLLVTISALALGAAGCGSSSSTAPPGETATDDSGSSDDATTTTDDGGTTHAEAGGGADGTAPAADGSTPGTDGSTAATDGAVATTDGGGLPPPNLSSVCPQTTTTNSTFATASALTLNSAGQARIGTAVTQGSDEWYSFMPTKSDPVTVTAAYTVAVGSTAQLELTIDDINDSYVAEDHSSRTTASQTLSATFESTAGGTFAVQLDSNSTTCEAADLYVQALECTDQYEDNDVFAQSAPVALDATTKNATISATIDGLDDDWYQIVAPKADPMSASVTYTRPVGDTVDLELTTLDGTDSYVAEDHSSRSGQSQTLTDVWEASAAGVVYNMHIDSNKNGVCAPYSATFTGLWCTDSFEDNDTFATAVALPATMQNATISSLDDDWYILSSPPANGSCTVSYTVAAGDTQQLEITIVDTGNGYVSEDHTGRTMASQTLTATWTGSDAPYAIHVDASDQICTSYTILCN